MMDLVMMTGDAEHDGERADVTTDGGNHRETKQDHQDHHEKTKHGQE